jgi:hypothetical protein
MPDPIVPSPAESSSELVWPDSNCPACKRSLAEVPWTARFCPSCGGILRVVLLPSEGQGQKKASAADDPRFAVREGYAAAMLRLGWRYESGLGASRNIPEAVRCYTKSAKLGNENAKERIAPVPVIAIEDSHLPAEDNTKHDSGSCGASTVDSNLSASGTSSVALDASVVPRES